MSATIVARSAGSEILLTSLGFYARCASGCQWISGLEHAKHKARAAAEAHDEACSYDEHGIPWADRCTTRARCAPCREAGPVATSANVGQFVPRKAARMFRAVLPAWMLAAFTVCLAVPGPFDEAAAVLLAVVLLAVRFRRAASAWRGGKSHRKADGQ